MNKGDVILLFILATTLAVLGVNEWNIVHNLAQFTTGEWTFLGIVLGGELLSFALYKSSKYKATTGKHSVADRLDAEERAAGAHDTEAPQTPTGVNRK